MTDLLFCITMVSQN